MVAKIPPKPDFLTQEEWDAQLSIRSPEKAREFTRKQIDRIRNGGWDADGQTLGVDTCLVNTIGRKSGEVRTSALIYYKKNPADKDLYVVASMFGLEDDPMWVLNLEALPQATVELPGEKWDADVHLLSKEEKYAMWDDMTKYFRMWGYFQKYCDRDFKVIRLSPKS